MSEMIKPFKYDGIATMPYSPQLRQLVEQAAVAWEDFCRLPPEEKARLVLPDEGLGYEIKDGSGPKGDRKENFDILTSARKALEAIPESRDFIELAISISEAMSGLSIDFARQIEDEYGLEGFASVAGASTASIFTRFIHYFGEREAGEEIATPHCDKSAYTFHLFETASGCQRLDYATRQWMDMPGEPGKMTAFTGMQLQYASQGELLALNHRVVATETTKGVGRHAIVCFVCFSGMPQYDKTGEGRLQEFEPGFNYDMPYENFTRLFK